VIFDGGAGAGGLGPGSTGPGGCHAGIPGARRAKRRAWLPRRRRDADQGHVRAGRGWLANRMTAGFDPSVHPDRIAGDAVPPVRLPPGQRQGDHGGDRLFQARHPRRHEPRCPPYRSQRRLGFVRWNAGPFRITASFLSFARVCCWLSAGGIGRARRKRGRLPPVRRPWCAARLVRNRAAEPRALGELSPTCDHGGRRQNPAWIPLCEGKSFASGPPGVAFPALRGALR
jgi:hypothetical protein